MGANWLRNPDYPVDPCIQMGDSTIAVLMPRMCGHWQPNQCCLEVHQTTNMVNSGCMPPIVESRLPNPCRLRGPKSRDGVMNGHIVCILLRPMGGQIGYIARAILGVHAMEINKNMEGHVWAHWLHNPYCLGNSEIATESKAVA